MIIRKKLPFSRANPQNLKRVWVPLTEFWSKNKFLAPPIQTLLLLWLPQISARGREIRTKKIPVNPNYLNQSPKNLLPKDKKTSTPSLLL
jgi:hypothetical protein